MAKSNKPHFETLGVALHQTAHPEQFTTLDVLNGLRGVCVALDKQIVDGDEAGEDIACLAQAAKVLSNVLANLRMP